MERPPGLSFAACRCTTQGARLYAVSTQKSPKVQNRGLVFLSEGSHSRNRRGVSCEILTDGQNPGPSLRAVALPKHHSLLILPRQQRTICQLLYGNFRNLPLIYQPLQHLWRQIGQAQLPAGMTLGEVHGDCQVAHCFELTGFHPPPPGPCTANGPQDMRILGVVLAG